MHMSLMRMNACIHVWCINLWCRVFFVTDQGTNQQVDYRSSSWFTYMQLWCMNVWCMYLLGWALTLRYVCTYDVYIFFILDPDACMYDAWMHDACIHNSFIYMILDPDACVYDAGMKDAYICDLWPWCVYLWCGVFSLRTNQRTDKAILGVGCMHPWCM